MNRNRRLNWETTALLVLARFVLWIVPFRTLVGWLKGTWWAGVKPQAEAGQIARQVSLAIYDACIKIPWTSNCLVQALAGYVLLRSRGVQGRVTLGVRKQNQQMDAHAWLWVGEVVVTGESGRTDYAEILSMGAKDS